MDRPSGSEPSASGPADPGHVVSFSVDADLLAAFRASADAQGKDPADILRSFLRRYVDRRGAALVAAARRSAAAIAARSADPGSDEAAVTRELDGILAADDIPGWTWR